jgi:hypothetical protein
LIPPWVDGSEPNAILNTKVEAREAAGAAILPSSFFVNQAALHGSLTTGEVFGAICPSYVSDSEPEFCKMRNKYDNFLACISIGHCQGSKPPNSVFTPVFAVALLGVIFFFSCSGLIQWQQTQQQMCSQVRGILADFMPIVDENK